MRHIKTFESFKTDDTRFIFILENEALNLITESADESNIEKAIEILETNGYTSPQDYLIIEAAGDIKLVGLKDDILYVDVKSNNGFHKYAYKEREDGLSIQDIAKKFEKMLQYASWNALNWLKKNTEPVAGTRNTPEIKESKLEENKSELTNYMFFQNLKTIKRNIDSLLAIDDLRVDELLKAHGWAVDHICTSKDDIEEVTDFISNMLSDNEEVISDNDNNNNNK